MHLLDTFIRFGCRIIHRGKSTPHMEINVGEAGSLTGLSESQNIRPKVAIRRLLG
jgi:hypothetical protein